MPTTKTLAAVRLSSLRRDDGVLMSALPVTVVSLQRQVRFESAFGRLASGPLAALYAPAGFRFALAGGDDAGGVFALSLAHAAQARRDLLPARVPIDADAFAALLACERDVPWVRAVQPGDALEDVLRWLHAEAFARHLRCSGRQVSRTALRRIGEVTASEDALIAGLRRSAHDAPLPPMLEDRAVARRFHRVTGFAPRRYAREWQRRAAVVPLL